MKKIYTSNDIDQFFNEFKLVADSFSIDKVHQIINNPQAVATRRAKFNFNHLKINIMRFSIALFVVSAIGFWHVHSDKQNNLLSNDTNAPYLEQSMNKKPDVERSEQKSTIIESGLQKETPQPMISESTQLPIHYNFTKGSDSLKVTSTKVESVLNGKKEIYVTLCGDELLKLGIITKGNGFYYHNVTPNGDERYYGFNMDFQYYFDSTSHFSFYARYQTDMAKLYLPDSEDLLTFRLANDTLVPVVICNLKKNSILWFTPNNVFFNTLPQRFRYLETIYNDRIKRKKETPNLYLTNYYNWRFLEDILALKTIKLEKTGFEKLNFVFDSTTLSIKDPDSSKFEPCNGFYYREGNSSGRNGKRTDTLGHDCILIQYYRKKSAIYSNEKTISTKEILSSTDSSLIICENMLTYSTAEEPKILGYESYTFNKIKNFEGFGFQAALIPVMITDIYGRELYTFKKAREFAVAQSNNNTVELRSLVPIKIPLKELLGFKDDRIFWYYPSNEFFDALPADISNEWRTEYQAYIRQFSPGAQKGQASCSYFEPCHSDLAIEKLKVYPNPAQNELNIEFTNTTSFSGYISLINMMGYDVKLLQPLTEFGSNDHVIKADISDIPAGIYILSIVSKSGVKTQRVIKMK